MSPPDDRWQDVCPVEDLVDGTGVCALVGGRQIAMFIVAGADQLDRENDESCLLGAPASWRNFTRKRSYGTEAHASPSSDPFGARLSRLHRVVGQPG